MLFWVDIKISGWMYNDDDDRTGSGFLYDVDGPGWGYTMGGVKGAKGHVGGRTCQIWHRMQVQSVLLLQLTLIQPLLTCPGREMIV